MSISESFAFGTRSFVFYVYLFICFLGGFSWDCLDFSVGDVGKRKEKQKELLGNDNFLRASPRIIATFVLVSRSNYILFDGIKVAVD